MELNYKEFGQGDPIIILHGLFGTSDNWQTIAKKLAKDYSDDKMSAPSGGFLLNNQGATNIPVDQFGPTI